MVQHFKFIVVTIEEEHTKSLGIHSKDLTMEMILRLNYSKMVISFGVMVTSQEKMTTRMPVQKVSKQCWDAMIKRLSDKLSTQVKDLSLKQMDLFNSMNTVVDGKCLQMMSEKTL